MAVLPFDDQSLFDVVQNIPGTGAQHRRSLEATQAPLYYVIAYLEPEICSSAPNATYFWLPAAFYSHYRTGH